MPLWPIEVISYEWRSGDNRLTIVYNVYPSLNSLVCAGGHRLKGATVLCSTAGKVIKSIYS